MHPEPLPERKAPRTVGSRRPGGGFVRLRPLTSEPTPHAWPANIPLERTRNIGIMAHIDAGQDHVSPSASSIYTGISHKIGEVHEGTATMDWMEQEQERGITITSAATNCFWTPDFGPDDARSSTASTSSTRPATSTSRSRSSAACACSTARSRVFDGGNGVEPQSETVWRQADKYHVPRIAFVNKMDKVGADFQMNLDSMRERLGVNPVPVQWPVGQEDQHRGVVDLIRMQAAIFDDDSLGAKYDWEPIPDDLQDKCAELREKLIESLRRRRRRHHGEVPRRAQPPT